MKYTCVVVVALLLSGCAAKFPNKVLMDDLVRARPVPLAQVNLKSDAPMLGSQPIEGELEPGAPVVVLDQGDSYYRLYRVTPRSGVIHLSVTSYCACLGFDKRVAVPSVRVLTSTGKALGPVPDGYEYEVEGPRTFKPLSVKLTVGVPGNDAAYVVVAADNSHMDGTVSRFSVNGFMASDIIATPVGRFEIREVRP